MRPPVPANAPEFVRNVEALMITGEGDQLPVSAMPIDGTFPTGYHEVGEAQHRAGNSGVG